MGFRFQKRFRLLPGVTLNLSKSGPSLSVGTHGARVTFGQKGIRRTFGLPGTGLSYSTYDSYGGKRHGGRQTAPAAAPMPAPVPEVNRVRPGLLAWLFLDAGEKAFLEGIRLFLDGDAPGALSALSRSTAADAAFASAGMLQESGEYGKALNWLAQAESRVGELGRLFGKYAIELGLALPVTPLVWVELEATPLHLTLLKAHLLCATGQSGAACSLLLECHRREPSELLIRLALAGLVVGNASAGDAWLKTIVTLTDGMENETWQHTALLYYRALALARLSLCDAAQAVLAGLGRRKSERPAELLLAVRYAQADIYEQQGKARQARAIWEKIFAENASDERARRKLGLS